jgi:choice-of-anchor B domain-containing protein
MQHRVLRLAALAAALTVGALAPPAASAQMPDEPIGHTPCVKGMAGPFACDRVDLMTFWPPDEFGGGPSSGFGGPGNDVWGWTDPETRKEWVLMGRSNGTSFIDITDPKRPVLVADLPRHQTPTLWSDIKVYRNHAFVVAEGAGNGMQVFDLTRLRDLEPENGPVMVDADAHYDRFGNSHNVNINEDTGFAYAVGTTGDVPGGNPCRTGLHMVDIRDPLDPTFAGCFGEDGGTHDVQCVIYHGPDERYQGREICFASNNSSGFGGPRVTTVDVTDKSNPVILSRTSQGDPLAFSHQSWLTDDHRYFLHDDESDEIRFGGRTRTRVFDVSDLENVFVQAVYHGETHAADHNLYIRKRFAYQANYFDGLRVVNIVGIDHPGDAFAPETPSAPDHQGLFEVACFDTDPTRNDIPGFGGSWSNYPFFGSGIVAVSGFDGLFIVRPRIPFDADIPPGATKKPPRITPNERSDGCLR